MKADSKGDIDAIVMEGCTSAAVVTYYRVRSVKSKFLQSAGWITGYLIYLFIYHILMEARGSVVG